MNLHRRKIKRFIHSSLHSQDKERYRALAHMVGKIPIRDIQKVLGEVCIV